MNPEARAGRLFAATFGTEPAAVRSAPGRVNLIGEHVDYHGGHVMPAATAWRTAVAVGPAIGLEAVSEAAPRVTGTWPPVKRDDWSDYVAGVASLLLDSGVLAGGLAAAVASDVPFGAGVSSSAALGVASAAALDAWAGRPLSGHRLADLAWRSETGFVGVPVGKLDQLASALVPAGSALLIDCRTLESRPVPVGVDMVLAESGDSHSLRGSEYVVRRREGDEAMALLRQRIPSLEMLVDIPPARLKDAVAPLPDVLARRVRHVVNENQRALLAAGALDKGDLATFGTLVNQSHDSLRDLYQCSTPKLDAIVNAARGIGGVLGARLMGAGWGGAVLIVAEPGRGEGIAEQLAKDDSLALPSVRAVRPGAGAAPD